MRAVTFVACCYAVALWIAASFFGLSDDILFFHSDLLSKSYFLAALGFLFLPAAILMVGMAAMVRRRHALRIAAAFPLALLLAGLAVASGEWAFGKIETFGLYALFMAAAITFAALLIWRLPNRGVVLDRTAQISRALLFVALPFTVAAWLAHHLTSAPTGGEPPRHVVMILVDGMPAELLNTYTPYAAPTVLDAAAMDGCVIEHAYTSRTYTSGYFSVLYSGDRTGTVRPDRLPLPRALEEAGAGFRWISFHANGFPETAHIADYGGLRSALLSERWAWLPRFLGLHYHVFLTWDETRRYMGDRVNTLYTALNGRTDETNFWRDVLPSQVREMQARYRRSLLLVHVSMTKNIVQALADGSYGNQTAEVWKLFEHAMANDYTYTPDQAPAVQAYRRSYVERMNRYGDRISYLLSMLERAHLSDQTLVLVTADHGSTFENGRLWYGPHADEQVARVPLFLFGGEHCRSEIMSDTLDVRATIDAYLGLRTDPPLGQSLIEPAGASAREARAVPVLTVRNDRRKTWFLAVHPTAETRYLFNLHPDGDGRAEKGRVHIFDVEGEPLGNEPMAWRMLADSLALYNIAPSSIHKDLRARIEHLAARQSGGR